MKPAAHPCLSPTGIEGSRHDHMRELRIQSGGNPLRVFYAFDSRRSAIGDMRELRIQSGGNPLRVFYAFDSRRSAILLIGGDKTGNDRFYETFTPVADELYDIHLAELRKEGLIK